jgi:uncharacterized damage-inducible protein DinB
MKTLTISCAFVMAMAAAASAQSISIKEGALKDWTSQRDTLLKIAKAMPEDKFGFKPTPAQRSWGEQLLHIAQANVIQLGRLGAKTPTPEVNMRSTAPAEILKALADSFDYGTTVIQAQTDETIVQAAASTRFDQFMGPSARVRVIYYDIGHTWDIYGQMAVYLRLNGITPPASQRF